MNMQRVAIVGSGGSGKSTLARTLGDTLGIPVAHLDALHWRPGWVEPPDEEWTAIQEELVQQPRWIIDGNYGRTLDIRLGAADTIIFLDLPRTLCLWRVFLRWLRYRGRSRPDMAEGCPEKLDWSFVRWIWTYPQHSRPVVLEKLEAARRAGKSVIVLQSPQAVAQFVEDVQQRRAESHIANAGTRELPGEGR